MRLDVFLNPSELAAGEVADRTAVVIDVLRASSTITQAVAAGARTIFPVTSIEEALRLANTLGRDEVLLCGERKCLPIDGFDLGNSPAEFTADRVAGKTLIMSTTNGTAALSAAAAAERVLIASWLNLSAVVDELVRSRAEPILVCAGRERHFGLDDAVLAGQIAARLLAALPDESWALNDGARAAITLAEAHPDLRELLPQTAAGRAIRAAGLGDDLDFCVQIDRYAALPVLHDRQITLATSTAEASAG